MNELAIIADDLTGATDSGVQFARRGFDTQVVLHAEEVSAIGRNSEIICWIRTAGRLPQARPTSGPGSPRSKSRG
ncbi:four-carbon acid sugar kinase family protein [Paenibacillus sp. NPDC093718]|uniref:four-carbon acid sugar kinase family protein n=1 Tax=Paenibacillus sp. NPDC093718 TaxID=3390601 RepID=UPI003CFCDF81